MIPKEDIYREYKKKGFLKGLGLALQLMRLDIIWIKLIDMMWR